jgi:hypothetical protein
MKNFIFLLLFTTNLAVQCLAQEQRNLLSTSYSFSEVRNSITDDFNWVPYPDYSDRKGWERIPAGLREQYIKNGEEYLNYKWQHIAASLYLEFTRSGSREVMQTPYRENQRAFESLVMAELLEGEGRFLDAIIDGVFYYCEQTYWGLSAHVDIQRAGAGLPDADEPTIDLGVGRVATNLAWTWYFLHEAFDKVHPLISKRLKSEIKKKVLTPYYTRLDMWWMGYTRDMVNNWNPWCNYNVLNCIVLMEEDTYTKALNVYKTMRSVDQFINYYKEDGGCDEGPGYWSHAGGKLFDYLEVLRKVSGGKIDIYRQPVVQNMGKYIYRAYISGEYFINFADASAKIHSRPGVIYRYGKRINDPIMTGFGAYLAKKYNFGSEMISGKIELALENLFNLEELLNAKVHEPLIGAFYLPETQIVGVRENEGTNQGFYFAAKGGHNGESHNHNDVGTFILYYNGQPALIDVGVETYSAKTFSSRRYEIWTMQSGSHNLPVINGIQQKNGTQFKAGEATFTSGPNEAAFSVDITGAYPHDAQVKHWNRHYTLQRGEKFQIRDQYELYEIRGKSSVHFMTGLNCSVAEPGVVQMTSEDFILQMRFDPQQFIPRIEIIKIEDARLHRAWGEVVSKIILEVQSKALKNDLHVDILELKD